MLKEGNPTATEPVPASGNFATALTMVAAFYDSGDIIGFQLTGRKGEIGDLGRESGDPAWQ
jgi:hypothetical protein